MLSTDWSHVLEFLAIESNTSVIEVSVSTRIWTRSQPVGTSFQSFS